MEQLPINMHLPLLKYRCALEISNYYQHKHNDDSYCLEIFRRAMVDGKSEAWTALHEQFRANIVHWLHHHAKSREALQIDSEQNYVDDTFKRLWQWGNKQQLEFRDLGGALKSLHLCLNSQIIDNLRSYARKEHVPLSEAETSTVLENGELYNKRELWQTIQQVLEHKGELRVIFLRYHEGLKPREIMKRCPGEFADEKEVYRLTRNALDRLKRNADLITWKIGYDE